MFVCVYVSICLSVRRKATEKGDKEFYCIVIFIEAPLRLPAEHHFKLGPVWVTNFKTRTSESRILLSITPVKLFSKFTMGGDAECPVELVLHSTRLVRSYDVILSW